MIWAAAGIGLIVAVVAVFNLGDWVGVPSWVPAVAVFGVVIISNVVAAKRKGNSARPSVIVFGGAAAIGIVSWLFSGTTSNIIFAASLAWMVGCFLYLRRDRTPKAISN
jgi:hypothetical protein